MVCSLLASFGNAQEYTTNNLIIKQGNKTYTINEAEQTITLRPEEFSIEYLNKAYQEKKNLFYSTEITEQEKVAFLMLLSGFIQTRFLICRVVKLI